MSEVIENVKLILSETWLQYFNFLFPILALLYGFKTIACIGRDLRGDSSSVVLDDSSSECAESSDIQNKVDKARVNEFVAGFVQGFFGKGK